MKICIGILAYNESERIVPLLVDLGRQTLLTNEGVAISLFVVANGCTDATVEVAETTLREFTRNIRTSVYSLTQAGKSNAWNEFIHKIVPPDTDFVYLLDADIRIPESGTLQLVLDGLLRQDRAVIAVDECVPDLSLRKPRTISEWLIRAGSGTAHDTRTAIAGSLYCAHFAELEKIWMPTGLPVEDGFLRAMILTSNFSNEEDVGRLVYVEGARHIFESERSLYSVFRHNVRGAIGTGINILLFHHLRKILVSGSELAEYIRRRNMSDPKWLNSLISERMTAGHYFIFEGRFVVRRFRHLRTLRISKQLKGVPILVIGTVFDALVYLRANTLMRQGGGAGYW